MIRLKRRRLLEASADLTPLMDVVFILLLFFLLTAVQAPLGISVQLPHAQSATQQEKDFIQLTLSPQQEILLNGNSIPLESLIVGIKNIIPPRPLLLAGDEQVSYGFLIRVLDRLSQVPDYPLVLATEPENNPLPAGRTP